MEWEVDHVFILQEGTCICKTFGGEEYIFRVVSRGAILSMWNTLSSCRLNSEQNPKEQSSALSPSPAEPRMLSPDALFPHNQHA